MLAILCHNPAAGTGDHSKEELLAALKLANIEARYCAPKSGDLPRLLAEPDDLIIVAGGDGAVAKIVKHTPDRNIPLGIIPIGTANNIARSFKIVGAPRELAKSWDLNRWRPLDIGLLVGAWGEHAFVEGVGLGPIPQVILTKSRDEPTPSARISAGREAVRNEFADAPKLDVALRVDGSDIGYDDIIAVEVLNVPYTGPRLPLFEPGAKPSGTLGVIVIRGSERTATISWLQAPRAGRAPFTRLVGRRVELTWRGTNLRVDDEVMDLPGGTQRATAEIDGRPVKVLAPANV